MERARFLLVRATASNVRVERLCPPRSSWYQTGRRAGKVRSNDKLDAAVICAEILWALRLSLGFSALSLALGFWLNPDRRQLLSRDTDRIVSHGLELWFFLVLSVRG